MGQILIAIAVVSIPLIWAAYLRFATTQAKRAFTAWQNVESSARVLLEDRQLPSHVGDLVELVVDRVGSGALSGIFFAVIVFGSRKKGDQRDSILDGLNPDQQDRYMRFLAHALYYDTLRIPVLGAALRRMIYWLAETATDKKASVTRQEIRPAAEAACRLAHA